MIKLLLIWGILHLILTFAITEATPPFPAGSGVVITTVYRTKGQDWIPPPKKSTHPHTATRGRWVFFYIIFDLWYFNIMKPDPRAYDHSYIEQKWQKEWAKKNIYRTKDASNAPKFYILDMFPYPSGEGLHVGHPKGYIATDVVSRMKRMQGFNVLHPMGFDAFGLPAENYAIKTKTNPVDAVKKNVARYKKQLEILGFDYDWDREINTTDPKYYKWTQWIFLKLLEKGLAYESYEPINWCPFDKTGLANEDVEDGKCERCGTLVEKKPMRQWVLRITDYAERLLSDLDYVDWPSSIVESQKNWIGKSEGAEIDFAVKGSKEKIKIFTTRPDTIYGVTYLAISESHALAKKKKLVAINPANGEEIPVFVADYVLSDYGTGAVMGVPAHDERDFEFAKKHNIKSVEVIIPHFIDKENLPVKGKKTVKRNNVRCIVEHPTDPNLFLCVKWKPEYYGGRTFLVTGGVDEGENPVVSAQREISEETGYSNIDYVGEVAGVVHAEYFAQHKNENRFATVRTLLFKLRDEIKTEKSVEDTKLHDNVWVHRDNLEKEVAGAELPWVFSKFLKKEHAYTGSGELYNSGEFSGKNSETVKKKIAEHVNGKWITKYKLRDWVFSRQRYWGEPIPVLHGEKGVIPVSEKELPVELPKVKSYEPTGTGESPLAGIKKWMNVKIGKEKYTRESNTMPQWAGSSWYYLRYMDPDNKKALVDKEKEKYWNQVDLYVGGAEHATRHLIYARFWHKFLYDIGAVSTLEPFKKLQHVGLIMAEDGRKMSKRYGNVVNPDDIVAKYGADTLRVYEMFLGPFDQQIKWDTSSIIGSRRFIERVWKLKEKVGLDTPSRHIDSVLHKTIKKVTEDISLMRFNTAVSSLMIALNEFEKEMVIPKSVYEQFVQLVAPFAPHIADEIWTKIGKKESIHISEWPTADEGKIQADVKKIVIQLNGKTKGVIEVSGGESREELEKKALDFVKVDQAKKVIFIPDKLINIVVT